MYITKYQVPNNVNNMRLTLFSGEYSGYVHVGPKNYFMPAEYRKIAAEIYNMPVRKDDVFVITFPRTGILNLLLNSIEIIE